jgi:hypothetical protein
MVGPASVLALWAIKELSFWPLQFNPQSIGEGLMISPSYNFREFIENVQERDYLDIISLAEKEAYDAEAASSGIKGSIEARKRGSPKYAALLKKFLFFLKYRREPAGIYEWDFMLFRPVCEKLIEKGQLEQKIIELFQ